MSSPRILLVSAWNSINIGSVSHAPGDIGVLEAHVPEAHVTLWATPAMDEVTERLLKQRYPKLDIVKGTINEDGTFSGCGEHPADRLAQAVQSSDFMLHGSSSGFQYRQEVAAYVRATGKPFGVLGVTDIRIPGDLELLNTAKFVYFRDTPGLLKAKQGGLAAPVMAYGPDSAFYCDWRNEAWAEQYLQEVGLCAGEFVCVIGRFRYTPMWRLEPNRPVNPSQDAVNEATKENDFAPLREAICAIVRETDMNVLVCPEDMTQMAIEKEMIIDLLPADVRPRVVWREQFWMTDEALSVYVRSA
ncbi:MAG: Polysaccharide pyruvyl transferase, partial [Paenibacillus sp.]|nr:Polysaccharide pyruvyl transferase [Paenibacillus sp.]